MNPTQATAKVKEIIKIGFQCNAYKFFNHYGFSWRYKWFNREGWGNKTPAWLKPLAKIIWKRRKKKDIINFGINPQPPKTP